ncbi:transcription factor-like protein [Perilla frutescens var. hirtella]|uniref:Transcription factor-like protein n=1 Tax=Perilla frutescens var. hirtella TaxID=608512 RepID=A0AAD4ITD9_PERFH|nr:transcription factor-like protein [Perilla frutescens var. hirtella]
MKTLVEEKFSDFYENWMTQLEDLLQHLLLVSKGQSQESGCAAAINKLTAHHKEYYKFKWAAAHDDVLAFFSNPVWLSPLEMAHLWLTGWKPSAAFRLLRAAAGGLTEEQARKIEALRMKMRAEEGRVEREMERLQVAVADRKTVELARLEKRVRENGGAAAVAAAQVEGLVEAAVGGFLAGLEKVMKMADCVRLKTLKGLLEILSPMQSVEFLASESMFQIRVWKWGQMETTKK